MSLPAFVDVRLPDDVEKGAQGGPSFNTSIIELDSGFERRNSTWAQARASYDVGYGIQYKKDFEDVLAFFYARRGKAVGFRFRDWADYEMPAQVVRVGGTGETQVAFQLVKTYEDTGGKYDRIIRKPVSGTVVVTRNGMVLTVGPGVDQYTIDYNTGIFTLGRPLDLGDTLGAACEFDVPVRFDTDKINITMETWQAGSVTSIPIIELKTV